MGIIIALITLKKAIGKKCYHLVSVCILFIIYDVLCCLKVNITEIFINYQKIISTAEIIAFLLFLSFVLYVSIKQTISKKPQILPMCFAMAAVLCRIVCVFYLRWTNNYIRQFLDDAEMFILISKNGMPVVGILLMIVRSMCLSILIYFLIVLSRKKKGQGDDSVASKTPEGRK